MHKTKIEELNTLYKEMEEVDQETFAEMRSNLLLVAGEHYSKKSSRYWNRIRDSKELSSEQKLRLTQNHIQKISKIYKNNILTYAPGVTILPNNETELQDQKEAELNKAVWEDAKKQYRLKEKIRDWCSEFIDIGEVAVKIFYDYSAGEFTGFGPVSQGENAELEVEEESQGEEAQGEPQFKGSIVYEPVYGFNLLRSRETRKFSAAKVLCIRKMVDLKTLQEKFEGDPEKLKLIKESRDKTYIIFDMNESSYGQSKNEVLVREFYYRPCHEYPMGYYYITTDEGILFEGELPFGIFPVVMATCEEFPTTPRGHSIIKHLRPYQAEVNRAASKMAEHQITLGDDKLLIQSGTKISHGGQVPGVRAVTYTGTPPTILGGRDGSQYLNYMNAKISEMYVAAMIPEDSEEKQDGVVDPYTMLFKSIKQKKKFSLFSDKFEQFLVDVCEVTLKLAKAYYEDDRVIMAVGRREQINLAEFKDSTELSYQIKIEPMSDDIETKMGKQLTMTQFLQYAGSKLDREDVGKILKNMPFANVDESFSDLTIDYENAKNTILQLDRGEMPFISDKDNHKYMIKKLTSRMKMADFKFLPEPTQMLYVETLGHYNELAAQELQQLQALESGFIPAHGHLVPVDFYVADPGNPNKTRRARLPYDSLDWLIKRLEAQGMSLEALEQMQSASLAGVAKTALGNGSVQPQGNGMEGSDQGKGQPDVPPPITGMPPGENP